MMTVLRTWRCTAGHNVLTVLEPDDAQQEYVVDKCNVEGCDLPVAERRPTEQDQ